MHFLGEALVRPRIPQLRKQALRVLARSFHAELPLGWVATRLGFDGDLRECQAWLRLQCARLTVTADGTAVLDTRSTWTALAASGPACGPPLPGGWDERQDYCVLD